MNHKHFIKPAAMAAIVALLLTSCGKGPEDSTAPATEGRIGMTCMDLGNPFFKLISEVMEEEAAKHGYKVVSRSANKDPAKQNNQISDFVAQEFDAIFLNPGDSKTVAEGVKKAHAAGIPVFTFDVQVADEEAQKLVIYHIGSDNYQGGRLAGESMMEATGDQGKIAVLSFKQITSCKLRVDGFKDYLKENNSKLQIIKDLSGGADREVGRAATTEILTQNPDIVGIFAINDPSAAGAYQAVKKAGKTDQITIVSFDASKEGKKAVFEKKFYDSPRQFPKVMAVGTVDAFIKYLDGEKFEKKKELILCEHYRYEDAAKDEGRGDW